MNMLTVNPEVMRIAVESGAIIDHPSVGFEHSQQAACCGCLVSKNGEIICNECGEVVVERKADERMPTDTPAAAAPSPLAVELMRIACKYHDDADARYLGAGDVAMASIESLLAPVREALSDARTDLAAAVRGFQNNEDAKIEARIHAKLDSALASLSPQPPEAPR